MIKKQIRFTDETRKKLKIDAVNQDTVINAVVTKILKDKDNWKIKFYHNRIPVPYSKAFIFEMTEDFRNDIIRNAKKINELSKEDLKITDEMIIHQIIENYYGNKQGNH